MSVSSRRRWRRVLAIKKEGPIHIGDRYSGSTLADNGWAQTAVLNKLALDLLSTTFRIPRILCTLLPCSSST